MLHLECQFAFWLHLCLAHFYRSCDHGIWLLFDAVCVLRSFCVHLVRLFSAFSALSAFSAFWCFAAFSAFSALSALSAFSAFLAFSAFSAFSCVFGVFGVVGFGEWKFTFWLRPYPAHFFIGPVMMVFGYFVMPCVFLRPGYII